MKKKDDLNQSLTKGEFVHAMEKIDQRFETMDRSIDQRFEAMDNSINKRFEGMLSYMNQRFDDVESRMFTKEDWRKDWDKLMVMVDRVMGETEESRRERLFSGEQYTRIEDTVRDHGKRIQKLEKAAA